MGPSRADHVERPGDEYRVIGSGADDGRIEGVFDRRRFLYVVTPEFTGRVRDLGG